ncbi:MAG: 23S rRNA (guanosine(2251)-2'-O)-methyltransferase RlmB [Bacteroidales bacterium]|nr:23S rRNA (guanosine(2251)-2'-O)-methyltransferase RlmB [Bacteroidales bacterium]
MEAIESGKEIDKVFIQKGLKGNLSRELFHEVRQHDIPFVYAPTERLNRFTRSNHQGVVALISPVSYQSIEEIVPGLFEEGKTPYILVLDGITDVRNLGAIVRTAECAGIDAVVVPAKGSAQINEDAVKTSAGALNRIPLCRSSRLEKSVEFLKDSGLKIFAATEKGHKTYYEADYTEPAVIIMGSEEKGISPKNLELADEQLKIPLAGSIASLNVSVAAGIIIFEGFKQRIGQV